MTEPNMAVQPLESLPPRPGDPDMLMCMFSIVYFSCKDCAPEAARGGLHSQV